MMKRRLVVTQPNWLIAIMCPRAARGKSEANAGVSRVRCVEIMYVEIIYVTSVNCPAGRVRYNRYVRILRTVPASRQMLLKTL